MREHVHPREAVIQRIGENDVMIRKRTYRFDKNARKKKKC